MATLMHNIMNHGQEMRLSDLSGETENTGCNLRQINSSWGPELTECPNRTQRWRELCNQALALGIPRAAVQRQPAGVIQSLINMVQSHSDSNQRENVLNVWTP